jgi:glycosyltransferase involved in cell wall biosynthesis
MTIDLERPRAKETAMATRQRFKIAQIGSRGMPGHSGGVERVVEAVAPRLAERGNEVVVYCADEPGPRTVNYRGVTLQRIKAPRSKHFDTISRSFVASMKEMWGSTQIVHYHGSGSAPLAILPRLMGKKVIVTVHGLDWQRRKWNIFGKLFLRFGEWAAVRFPHKTVVVGPDLKTELDKLYNVRTLLIPNGVEDRTPRPPRRIAEEFGLGERNFVLFLARLVPEKQVHTLIEAWMGLENKGGQQLVVAGPAWHSAEYAASLHEMAKDDPSVRFVGEVGEEVLEELYSNCSAYVLPSEVEGMSLSLLDSMAFGACVISSDIPANSYVVGDAGMTFPVRDANALRERLKVVIEQPEVVEGYRKAAKDRITHEFRWDRVTDRWQDLYAELMG